VPRAPWWAAGPQPLIYWLCFPEVAPNKPTTACDLSATVSDKSSGIARVLKPVLPSTGKRTMATLALLILTAPVMVSAVCDVCGIRNPHTSKDYSTPFEAANNYPACKMYKDAACCDADITTECGSEPAV
jgi:hypothetical protein